MITTYHPSKWVILRITSADQPPYYRVFASWGDSWKINSGIIAVRKENKHYHFEGSSGSIYVCFEASYGTTVYGYSVIQSLVDQQSDEVKIEVMPEDTDWLALEY